MYWCPKCSDELQDQWNGFECPGCRHLYQLKNGFCVFDDTDFVNTLDYRLDRALLDIESKELSTRLHRYLLGQLGRVEGMKILAVGCGPGTDIQELNRLGAEAYGTDFLYRTPDWKAMGFSKYRFFVSSAARIPFPAEYFDAVLCMGVIEHVSESLVLTGNSAELDREREAFLGALFNVLRPGGVLIVTSPNRNFPIDFQHNANGSLKMFVSFSVYVHSPLTRFLESYYSLSRHFRKIGRHKITIMPLVNLFGFNVFKLSPQLAVFKRFFDIYLRLLDDSPNFVRRSFLNPYVAMKIEKLEDSKEMT